MYCSAGCSGWLSSTRATLPWLSSSWGKPPPHIICWFLSVRSRDFKMSPANSRRSREFCLKQINNNMNNFFYFIIRCGMHIWTWVCGKSLQSDWIWRHFYCEEIKSWRKITQKETNKVKKECYLIRQYNIKHFNKMFKKIQDKSKLQKQIRKLLILTETVAWKKQITRNYAELTLAII